MNYIEAPNEYEGDGCTVFLAGGISDVGNWQRQLVESLQCTNATILNPRRKEFPTGDQIEEQRQIAWEHQYLSRADVVAFWFTPQTLCPIALFELGACCESRVPLVVGVDPNYARKLDVCVHLSLRRPEVNVLDSLEDLTSAIVMHPALVERSQ